MIFAFLSLTRDRDIALCFSPVVFHKMCKRFLGSVVFGTSSLSKLVETGLVQKLREMILSVFFISLYYQLHFRRKPCLNISVVRYDLALVSFGKHSAFHPIW